MPRLALELHFHEVVDLFDHRAALRELRDAEKCLVHRVQNPPAEGHCGNQGAQAHLSFHDTHCPDPQNQDTANGHQRLRQCLQHMRDMTCMDVEFVEVGGKRRKSLQPGIFYRKVPESPLVAKGLDHETVEFRLLLANGSDFALDLGQDINGQQRVDGQQCERRQRNRSADQEDRDNEDQREGNIDDRVEQRTLEYVAHAVEIAQPHDLGADRRFGQHRIWKMQDAFKGLVADNRINPSAEIGL